MAELKYYTSESVSEGHPDKLADQISDALLDDCLRQDPTARVAIETLLTRGLAVIAGEVTVEGYVNVAKIVRDAINAVGYTDTALGHDGDTCGVMVAIQEQSPDIAVGVDTGGAGDQGMMFGMATNETVDMMPLPISIAHALMRKAAHIRHKHPSLGLRPDAKSQVTIVYEGIVPKKIDTVVLSHQHDPNLTRDAVENIVMEHVVRPVLAEYEQYMADDIKYYINPTGIFTIGGPQADTGLTGRKIIVDTYGGMCPHGGGAFSGKDPTKVDRSAAYMARQPLTWPATSPSASSAPALPIAPKWRSPMRSVSLSLSPSTSKRTVPRRSRPPKIEKKVRAAFDMSPKGIIDHLGLRAPIYKETAKNGHFGNPNFPWERTTDADRLK